MRTASIVTAQLEGPLYDTAARLVALAHTEAGAASDPETILISALINVMNAYKTHVGKNDATIPIKALATVSAAETHILAGVLARAIKPEVAPPQVIELHTHIHSVDLFRETYRTAMGHTAPVISGARATPKKDAG
ncbi:MAG: hypothetical protein C0421_05860 [Hyphomonas sp.]|uniref:hypothetical protein n=1 Tax=Hyphomonas sp. TaxID=87 RepID=UPI0025C6C1F5|nr:hypothetical protein [Hyphomonas sp.]MBA4338352.1 hypothetical protein [Hyphomonas sp.]